MSKKCAKCTKTVYPTEELKCLDKIWHKACFKCEVCGMTLNMKNYKGYEKLPYCNAHYPTTKHTQVADTPESRRIAENTKIQSQVQYHADFEKQKGHKTSVADDPETARIRQNTAIQSNINYWGVREQRTAMEERRPQEQLDDVASRRRNPGKISDYDPGTEKFNSPYSAKTQANIVYDSNSGEGRSGHGSYPVERRSYTNDRRSYTDDRRISGEERRSYTDDRRISGEERRSYTDDRRAYTEDRRISGGEQRPYTDDRRSYTEDPRRSYTEDPRRSYTEDPRRSYTEDPRRSYTDDRKSYSEDRRSYTENLSNAGRRQPGSISDYDPMNQQFGSVGYQPHPEPVRQPQPYQPPPPQPQQPQRSRGMVCKAMYDYQAADTDEVSFVDGDIIIECQPVDAGWMTGRVERSGQYGMLPSNYVERIN